MAVATYLTRVSGFWAAAMLPRGTRARAALEAVPISILMSVIAPSLFLAGPAEFIAGCVAAIAATRLPLIATVAVGVGAVVLLRAGLG